MKKRKLVDRAAATPPYLQIALSIQKRIERGEWRAGEQIPSTRNVAREWGVAIATATRALTELRHRGMIEAIPRACCIVAAKKPKTAASLTTSATREESAPDLTQEHIVRAAIALADTEGLGALSMRAVAARLEIPTMTTYRYVRNKEQLVLLMVDAAFGESALPSSRSLGWRSLLELGARLQWALYRRHPWVAQVVTLTRPLPLPNLMARAEWMLQAIDGYGLDAPTMLHVHMTAFNFVRGIAVNLESEKQAEADSGVTDEQWADAQAAAYAVLMASGNVPTFSRMMAELSTGYDLDLDAVFEFGLLPMLDGLGRYFPKAKKKKKPKKKNRSFMLR